MALNFTPLSAYRFEVDKGIQQRAMNQARMGQGLGAAIGAALGMSQAAKTRDFFAQFDDSEEIEAIDEQIKQNEERIKELEKELEGMGE